MSFDMSVKNEALSTLDSETHYKENFNRQPAKLPL